MNAVLQPEVLHCHTLAECEAALSNYRQAYIAAAQAMLEVRDRLLYAEAGFQSIEEYAFYRWEIRKSHCYRLMRAGLFVRHMAVTKPKLPVPQSESHFRPLARLRPRDGDSDEVAMDRLVNAWEIVVDTAKSNKAEITQKFVADVVDIHFRGGAKSKPRTKSEGTTLKYLETLFDDIAGCGLSPERAVKQFGPVSNWALFAEALHWMQRAMDASE